MKTKCNNTIEGAKLHAYELDLLSKDETEQFEMHLMNCESCLSNLNSFTAEAKLLNKSAMIKEQISGIIQSLNTQNISSAPQRLSGFSNFKLILGLVIIISLGAFGISQLINNRTHQTQKIKLAPSRSLNEAIVNDGSDFEFLFVYENSSVDKCYVVKIVNAEQQLIYENSRFCDFDQHNLGRLTLEAEKFPVGHYKLTITDPENSSLTATQEYRFTISVK